MKLSFSTLGCPGWDFSEILSAARDLGYDGVEIRGVGNEIYAPKIADFSPSRIDKTISKIASLQLTIPCLTSGALINGDKRPIVEIKEHIDLAARLGTPYVRVLGDAAPAPGPPVDDEAVAAGLMEAGEYAANKNVTLLIETNGVFADSQRLAKLIEACRNSAVGVLWDIHHPFRYFNQTPAQTYDELGKWIKHVHIKDSIVVNHKVSYRMLGYGDLPLAEFVSVLSQGGYGGFLSLEWVKRWYVDLEEPGVAFAGCINYMKELL